MTAPTWVAFVLAGAVGAPLRYVVEMAITARWRRAFPLGTLVVNATGSLVLGVLVGLGLFHGLSLAPRLVLGTGLCGAYTTFSTFAFQTVELADDGARGAAARNVGLTVVVCAATAAIGLAVASL